MPTKHIPKLAFSCLLLFSIGQYAPLVGQEPEPVVITASATADTNVENRYAITVEMAIEDGWHAYASVPDGQPYTLTTTKLQLPEAATPSSEWNRPVGLLDPNEPEIRHYEGTVQFSRSVDVMPTDKPMRVGVVVEYQVCKGFVCQPPQEVTTFVTIPGPNDPAASTDGEFVNKYYEAPTRLMVGDQPLNVEARQMYPSPAMYDVDNDGQIELIVGDIFGTLNVYENENTTGSGEPVWSRHTALKTAEGKQIKVSNW